MTSKTQRCGSSFPRSEKEEHEHEDADDGGPDCYGVEDVDHGPQA
jgi:hypothetical protein